MDMDDLKTTYFLKPCHEKPGPLPELVSLTPVVTPERPVGRPRKRLKLKLELEQESDR